MRMCKAFSSSTTAFSGWGPAIVTSSPFARICLIRLSIASMEPSARVLQADLPLRSSRAAFDTVIQFTRLLASDEADIPRREPKRAIALHNMYPKTKLSELGCQFGTAQHPK